MRAVVVTTVSLTANLDHQLRCLRGWEALGVTPRVAAPARDLPHLEAANWPQGIHLEVPLRETALDLEGRAAPCLVPLLRRIARLYPGRMLILASPGLYPALSHSDALDDWQTAAPALALGAEEVPLLETALFTHVAPARSRLDTFVIGPETLIPLADRLEQWPVAEEMCMGDAGWDLMLGAVIASEPVGGIIADSGVLLREGTGDKAPREAALRPYVGPLRALGLAEAPDTLGAAEDCAAAIDAACQTNAALSRRIRAFYFDPPTPTDLPPETINHAMRLQHMIPWVRWNYDLTTLAALAARITGPAPLSARQIMAALNTGPNLSHQASEALLAMVLWALCAPGAARVLRPDFAATPALAQEHRAALARLQSRHESDLVGLRHGLITQIACDMIDHGVWSGPMRDALAMACQNDADRLLYETLITSTGKVAHAA